MNRRNLIVMAVVLVLISAALGGCLWQRSRHSPIQDAALPSTRVESQPLSTSIGSSTGAKGNEDSTAVPGQEPGAQSAVPRPPVPATDIAGLARLFDEERALEQIAVLASDDLNGRQAGAAGGRAAGDHIAERFSAYGLEPAGINGTYYQTFTVPYGRITGLPVLDVAWSGG